SPLASLTNLTWLDLAYNQISDISPLASFTNLTVLHLSYNQINDIPQGYQVVKKLNCMFREPD
ncbi:unnamed protein product, partial [marine sediment metagenome]